MWDTLLLCLIYHWNHLDSKEQRGLRATHESILLCNNSIWIFGVSVVRAVAVMCKTPWRISFGLYVCVYELYPLIDRVRFSSTLLNTHICLLYEEDNFVFVSCLFLQRVPSGTVFYTICTPRLVAIFSFAQLFALYVIHDRFFFLHAFLQHETHDIVYRAPSPALNGIGDMLYDECYLHHDAFHNIAFCFLLLARREFLYIFYAAGLSLLCEIGSAVFCSHLYIFCIAIRSRLCGSYDEGKIQKLKEMVVRMRSIVSLEHEESHP